MKYAVIAEKTNDDFMWSVLETTTGQIVQSFYFEEDAVEASRFYEAGGGFDGFTPNFMLQSVTYPVTNVNDEFTRVFV